MTPTVAPVGAAGLLSATTLATHVGAKHGASGIKGTLDPRLKKAAEDFEQAFVRKVLESAHFGGKDGEKGYGAMALEALASGLESAGGMGLARQIERALSRQHEAERPGASAVKGK